LKRRPTGSGKTNPPKAGRGDWQSPFISRRKFAKWQKRMNAALKQNSLPAPIRFFEDDGLLVKYWEENM